MPEIKHNFMGGKMNKDLDERLVPNGEYRDAMNVQVSTSEGSEVGTIQNILGNSLISGQNFITDNAVCVGSVADEKNDRLYYFITQQNLILNGEFNNEGLGWTVLVGPVNIEFTFDQLTFLGGSTIQADAPGIVPGYVYSLTYEVVEPAISTGILSPVPLLYIAGTTGPNGITSLPVDTVGLHTVNFELDSFANVATPGILKLVSTTNMEGTIDNIFVKYDYRGNFPTIPMSHIIEYDSKTKLITPVLVDALGDLLNFSENNLITGINVIDDLLLWTDNTSEPKKISISRCKIGTNPDGTQGTNLIVENNPEGPIKEEHITVIKKSPSRAPDIAVSTNLREGYVKGNLKKRPHFYPPGENANGDNYALVEVSHEMWIGLNNNPSAQHPDLFVGDVISIYNGYEPEDDDIPVARLLIKEVRNPQDGTPNNPSGNFYFPQIQNNFGVNLSNGWDVSNGFISGGTDAGPVIANQVAYKVAVLSIIDHEPVKGIGPTFASLAAEYSFQLEQEGKGIFEQKLPRFAYRYKYEDNEYSSVGPFSEVVFIPNTFSYHPTEAYNKGMINNLKELTLKDFVTVDIPKDVVEIDLLYKNEFSPNIYVVKTISKNDSHWDDSNFDYQGSYTITTENIYAQLPSDQLLRPWDNVPRKALAQEVTGNRVVYGNYVQNFDLIAKDNSKVIPSLTANLDNRFDLSQGETNGALKSIKSQRTYNFGIVYGDEYGRESPVFTNNEANQLILKASSADSNAISINVNSESPSWADYYKIFVKETSNEYYNLAMGRIYDAEDGNVWISFPSIDRNKVDEDTYLVLKKGVSTDNEQVSELVVTEDARYKIVAIENEAPDYIKTNYSVIAEPNKLIKGALLFGGHKSSSFLVSTPAQLPTPGYQRFTIESDIWEGDTENYHLGLANMLSVWADKRDSDLYVSFSNKQAPLGTNFSDAPRVMSNKYKIVDVNPILPTGTSTPGYRNKPMYEFKLSEVIPQKDAWYTENVALGNTNSGADMGGGLKPHFYKKVVENKPEFDGRFFVKIYRDEPIRKYLDDSNPVDNDGWKVLPGAINQLYYINDKDSIAPGDTTGIYASKKRSHWSSNLQGESNNGRWFIDAAAFAGLQPENSDDPKASITNSNSIQLSDIDSLYYYAAYYPNTDAVTGAISGGVSVNDAITAEGLVRFSDGTFNNQYGQAHTLISTTEPPYYANGANSKWDGRDIYPTATIANPSFNILWNNTYIGAGDTTSGDITGRRFNANTSYNTPPEQGPDNFDYGPIYTDLYKSYLAVELKPLGTKQSKGAAFLKGAHTASYDPSLLGDLVTNGGYDSNGSDLYLHLSFGNIGPTKSIPAAWETAEANFAHQRTHIEAYYDNYEWNKNWNVGVGGGANVHTDNQKSIVSNLKMDMLFRLYGDPDIYKIKSVTARKLYNYQGAYHSTPDYFNQFEAFMLSPSSTRTPGDPSDTFNTTNTIEPKNIRLEVKNANPGGVPFSGRDTSVISQHFYMTSPLNCRLSYLIKYEVVIDPTSSAYGTSTDGISENTEFTALTTVSDFARLEFLEEFSTNEENLLPVSPAIFETEPKEDLGLDIYYEATGKIPTNNSLFTSKIQNLIQIGAFININPSSAVTGVNNGGGAFVVNIKFDTVGGRYWIIELSAPILINELGQQDAVLKFYNNDGTWVTATWADPDGVYPATTVGGAINELYVDIHFNTIGLGWFNCWSFGNGVESNRIGDTFNKPFIANGVKASTTLLDSYKEEHRKYGLIYSGIYNSTSGINDLNQFIAANKITKDINPIYGSIQKLHSRSTADGDLITLCEDRVLKILANKDALFNADGNPQLIANNNVLGQAMPFVGDFGISTNPESFASESYRVYFIDKIRGSVVRLSKDGLTPISDHGMKDWFRDNLKLSTKLTGSYDDRQDEYNITLADRKILGEELIVNGNFNENVITDLLAPNTYESVDNWVQDSGSNWVWNSQNNNMQAAIGSPGSGQGTATLGQHIPKVMVGKKYEITYVVSGPNAGYEIGVHGIKGVLAVSLHDENNKFHFLTSPTSPFATPNNPVAFLPTSLGKHTHTVLVSNNWVDFPVVGLFSSIPGNSIQFHIEQSGSPIVSVKIASNSASQSSSSYFNGTIDDVSVREILSEPITVSFKEDVKGWVSFKSFTPENALSMASNYYSMTSGKLYQHHDENVDRNNFYGVGYNSSVNVLLNDLPGVVKTFHALNYEGSQCRVLGAKSIVVEHVNSIVASGNNPGSPVAAGPGYYFYFEDKKEINDLIGYNYSHSDIIMIKQYRNGVLIHEGLASFLDGYQQTLGGVNYGYFGSFSSQASFPNFIGNGSWEIGDVITTQAQEDIAMNNISLSQDGWYASNIITNKQQGSILEFIEKEGKWFNYIQGEDIGAGEIIDFGAFDLQGIGFANDVNASPQSSDGSEPYDPNEIYD